MNKQTTIALLLIGVIALGAGVYYLSQPQPVETRILKIYCAGSLVYPMEEVAEAFMLEHPEIEIHLEGHGSIQVIRHPTELDDPADLLMVADYSLIPLMMYDKQVPDTDYNYTDWYVRFAGNEVVLAYTDNSLRSDELTEDNWYEILSDPEVKMGISNPIIDALGYRALIIFQLAEYYYGETRIFENGLGNWFDPEFGSVDLGDRTVIFVPEEEKPMDKISMRASSVQLFPLLEAGGIDYAFLYKSNAEQHGFNYLELPDEVNLGNPEYDDYYAQAQVRFQHARFQSIGLDRVGGTIYYGLTISRTAENPEDAALLAAYIIGGDGKAIFEELHHPIFDPALTDNISGCPDVLEPFLLVDTYK